MATTRIEPDGTSFGNVTNVSGATLGDDQYPVTIFNDDIAADATVTTISSNDNPSCGGSPVTFTATVTSGVDPVTAGTVEFKVDGIPVQTVSLSNSGQAVFSTSSLAAGSHTITATFSGTADFVTSNGSVTQINDAQAPTMTCPSNITVSDPCGAGAVVTYDTPIASDNCPGATVTVSPASGSFFPPGTTTVTATATDLAGNSSSCIFTVTVNGEIIGHQR